MSLTGFFFTFVLASIHSRLRHFEVVTQKSMRTRTKRHAGSGNIMKKSLTFDSLGIHFDLDLTPGWAVVNDRILDCQLIDVSGNATKITLKSDELFSGFLKGQEGISEVDAFRLRNVWTAHIVSSGEHFTLEPLNKHDPGANPAHMVIFKTKDFIHGNITSLASKMDDSLHDELCLRIGYRNDDIKTTEPRFKTISLGTNIVSNKNLSETRYIQKQLNYNDDIYSEFDPKVLRNNHGREKRYVKPSLP